MKNGGLGLYLLCNRYKFNDSLKPYHWYKDFVVSGARENNLPRDYIKLLEREESIDDSDKSRVDKNKPV
jgi:hypothetical protein